MYFWVISACFFLVLSELNCGVIGVKSRITSSPDMPDSAVRWCFWYGDASSVVVVEGGVVVVVVVVEQRSYPETTVDGNPCEMILDEEPRAARTSAWWRGYAGFLVFVDSA